MAILGNIRKTGNTFIVIVISFFVVMFFGSDLFRVVYGFFSNRDQIGTLLGEKISYEDYYKACEMRYRRLDLKGKQPTAADLIRLKDYAWRQLVEDMLYSKEIKEVGLMVGAQELVDLVQGGHIDGEILEAFKDPKTDQFDKKKLLNYLSDLSKSKNGQEWWQQIEKGLAMKRAKKKLHQLMVQSHFTTALEKEQSIKRSGLFCNAEYIYIPFTSVKDDLIPITDQQLQDYMVAHKNHYKALSENRTIKYITFPIQPNEKDQSDFKKKLDSLVAEFSTTTDPYNFAKTHTNGNPSDTHLVCTTDTLPDAFLKIKHTLKEGMVIGPTLNDRWHTLYKLVKQEKDNYEIARIEKKNTVGEDTRNKCLQEIAHFTGQVKTLRDLDQVATKAHLTIREETLSPSDASIGPYAAAREVVCWLYNNATVGKISPPFDLGDVFLVAVMVDQVKAGDLLPLKDSVFRKVYQKVLHQKKAKIILDKLKQIQATSLQGIAKQYGQGIMVKSVQKLRFLENDDPHLKQAPTFVGKCFGLKLKVISDPIIDDTGIFIACVKNKYSQPAEEKINEQMGQIERWMQSYYIPSAMEELAQVTDQRYRVE